jgi:ssDNA-binding Zn-finger/Zn-ribbon topoisomerase 1
MTAPHSLLACLVGPCPECGHGLLQVVSDGELTNLLCPECGICWHAELGAIHRIDPATCPGCPSREICLAAVRHTGARPGYMA